jgi:hypothetical protein
VLGVFPLAHGVWEVRWDDDWGLAHGMVYPRLDQAERAAAGLRAGILSPYNASAWPRWVWGD